MTQTADETAIDEGQVVEELVRLYHAAERGVWDFCIRMAEVKAQTGETWYGIVSEVARRTGSAPTTLDRYASMALTAMREGWLERRLSVAHHLAVQRRGLSAEDRASLIKLAAEQGLSVSEVRALAAGQQPKGDTADDVASTVYDIVDDPDWTMVVGERGTVVMHEGCIYLRIGKYLLFLSAVQ